MTPEEITKSFSKLLRKWSDKRLIYLAECVIETVGNKDNHPFMVALKTMENWWDIAPDLPAVLPHQVSITHILMEYQARETGMYLKQQAEEREMKEAMKKMHQVIASAMGKASLVKRYKSDRASGKLPHPRKFNKRTIAKTALAPISTIHTNDATRNADKLCFGEHGS